MTDNNNNAPQYSKQIEEDLPSQEELVENPYCDDDSAPVAQNFSGNNQPQYYNPPTQGGAQQIKQTYPGQAPYSTPPLDYNSNNYYNNGINNNNQPQKGRPERGTLLKNKKFLMSLVIILIIVTLIDTGLQIGFNFFSPFLLADDLAILTSLIIKILLLLINIFLFIIRALNI